MLFQKDYTPTKTGYELAVVVRRGDIPTTTPGEFESGFWIEIADRDDHESVWESINAGTPEEVEKYLRDKHDASDEEIQQFRDAL
jgi:hypothetical protein